MIHLASKFTEYSEQINQKENKCTCIQQIKTSASLIKKKKKYNEKKVIITVTRVAKKFTLINKSLMIWDLQSPREKR